MDKVKQDDIALYIGAIPADFCDKVIREFHKGFALKEVIEGVVSAEGAEAYRSDDFLVAKDIHLSDHERWDRINCMLHTDYILPALSDYLKDYKYVVYGESQVYPRTCILSLYPKDKGHFCPHQDSIGGLNPQRSLTVLCYFNTVINGGCTNFFNQNFRVSPGVGNIVIFPSNFVYGHIGEPPLSGDKYISVSFASVDVGDENKIKHYMSNDKQLQEEHEDDK